VSTHSRFRALAAVPRRERPVLADGSSFSVVSADDHRL